MARPVNHHQVIIGEKPFVTACARAQHGSVVQHHRQIAVHGDQEVPFVAQVADSDHLLTCVCFQHFRGLSCAARSGQHQLSVRPSTTQDDTSTQPNRFWSLATSRIPDHRSTNVVEMVCTPA